MYYGIVSIAVLMFSVQFFFTDRYEKEMGSGAASTFFYSLLSAIAGGICLFFVTGINIGVTPFTLIMATATAADTAADTGDRFRFCNGKFQSTLGIVIRLLPLTFILTSSRSIKQRWLKALKKTSFKR